MSDKAARKRMVDQGWTFVEWGMQIMFGNFLGSFVDELCREC